MRRSIGIEVVAVLLAAVAQAACGDDATEGLGSVSDAGAVKVSARGGAGAGGVAGRSAAGSGSAGRAGAGGRPATPNSCGIAGPCPASKLDERGCPSLDFAGILMLPSCCTTRDMCGIDASSVGGGGCVDLATAAERARLAGASVLFPAPRACADLDAGADDAGE